MKTAICDDCKAVCDAGRMQYIVEVQTPAGKTVSIAPTNNAYLDRREMAVLEAPAGVSESQLAEAPVLVVCNDCIRERAVFRSRDGENDEVNPEWYKLRFIAKNDEGQEDIAIRVLPYGEKASRLPLGCWHLKEGDFLGGTAFTAVYYKATRDDTLEFSSQDNTFGFFVKVGSVKGHFPRAMLIEYGSVRAVPFSRN
ncbi:MAG: hypothetical protein OXI16_13645 [Chloroflexota bacterium]|nr:hypothetical protein [Chloroflexota bacterium]